MDSNEFTNELIHESSPYLQQHAHNPVQWYPWSEKALQLSKATNKPILVSIGYSACHWCHVMERESFEDVQTAAVMNEFFINIKIDREERPDLDNIYMEAVQILTGSGGWPLNVFLTPEGLPFYGGTYFPTETKFNRPSWKDVLFFINDIWINRRQDAIDQANKLTTQIDSVSASFNQTTGIALGKENKNDFTGDYFSKLRNKIMDQADSKFGGFGRAPKFPQSFSVRFLLMYSHFFKDEIAKHHALFSLTSLLNGGINDQLAGGFARYSTDDQWLAPHFEKMLYDNALIIDALCDAYKITSDELYKDGIEKTLSFCFEKMLCKEGGYYAALDADSEGEEGKFYVWDQEEIELIIGEDAELFCKYFGVEKKGNWENKNILHIKKSISSFAIEEGIEVEDCKLRLKNASNKLIDARNKRIHPSIDDKIILSWNALLLHALCNATATLDVEIYKDKAVELYEFIMNNFTEDGITFFHTYKHGEKKQMAFLDDYAFLIRSCIALQEITGNEKYLDKAELLTTFVIENFKAADAALFYYTAINQTDVIIRKIEIYDNAIPSGNSIMADNLFYLSKIFEKQEWEELAQSMFLTVKQLIDKYPATFAVWASILLKNQKGLKEIVVTGQHVQPLRSEVLKHYIPEMIFQSSNVEKKYPLLKNKDYLNDGLIYVCENFSCAEPVDNIKDFEKIMNC
jgi:uncharacterized protein YyaL (SSP411 family)